ncbi:MAG: DNA-binding protein [Betaproteobacteria bacterium]|nr:DNA-binding protein [Betaproteobacteria bacterium]
MNTEHVKARIRKEGKTIKEWAEERGVTDYPAVIRVLNGFNKGTHGKAHKVAVALGLKEGCHE